VRHDVLLAGSGVLVLAARNEIGTEASLRRLTG
jgi:hypothetical protein